MSPIARALPKITMMRCGQLPQAPRRGGSAAAGPKRQSVRTAPVGITPSTIMSPSGKLEHRDKAGRLARATHHTPNPIHGGEATA